METLIKVENKMIKILKKDDIFRYGEIETLITDLPVPIIAELITTAYRTGKRQGRDNLKKRIANLR